MRTNVTLFIDAWTTVARNIGLEFGQNQVAKLLKNCLWGICVEGGGQFCVNPNLGKYV